MITNSRWVTRSGHVRVVSREVWSWPGDRLPVGDEMSQQVERLTRRLKLETEAHVRLEALFKTAGGGRSVLAL